MFMKSVNMKDAVWAGIISGLIFMMLEMIMVPMFLGGSPWGPPRMMAAIVLGQEVLPPPGTFDFGIVMAAVVLHLVISIIYAIILALILGAAKTSFWVSILIGAVFGYLLYLVNFYVFTAVFPWFAEARNWVSAFAHIIFGIAAAWSYVGLVSRHAHSHEVKEHHKA
jgi:uncharacterized membrane protein YagU involved in acid resistance